MTAFSACSRECVLVFRYASCQVQHHVNIRTCDQQPIHLYSGELGTERCRRSERTRAQQTEQDATAQSA